jgi:hypothetical protein
MHEVTSVLQGAMRFTEPLARNQYANMVVHTLIPPQKVYDLAEDLASRMRQITNNRQWMGAHMRRGDCTYPLFKQRAEKP